MRGMKANNSARGDWSPGACKGRDVEIHPKDPGQHQHTRTTKDHSIWNAAYPKKITMYQIDLYFLLTLGPRNGPRYYVVLNRHQVKGYIIMIVIIIMIFEKYHFFPSQTL